MEFILKPIALILRALAKLRFRILNLATIDDIPSQQFNAVIKELIAEGWGNTYTYDGFDAWIDYGKIKLKKQGIKLTCEWDNWTEGSIEGPRNIIESIGKEKNMKVTYEWRWSKYDNN